MTSTAFLQGFATSAALIIAIGAQNAFVLRQGIRREHVGVVVAVCAISDVLLIGIGVAGLGALVQREPLLLAIARWGGAAFLLDAQSAGDLQSFRRSHAGETLRGASDYNEVHRLHTDDPRVPPPPCTSPCSAPESARATRS